MRPSPGAAKVNGFGAGGAKGDEFDGCENRWNEDESISIQALKAGRL